MWFKFVVAEGTRALTSFVSPRLRKRSVAVARLMNQIQRNVGDGCQVLATTLKEAQLALLPFISQIRPLLISHSAVRHCFFVHKSSQNTYLYLSLYA